MNILFYLYNQFTGFITNNTKKLLIFISFLLGILFSLLYIWHIHKYYFVFPKSTLLYVLSSISFLASILIVLKYAHDTKILKKIIQGILLICLLLFIGFILSELKVLEHKFLRFRLIKIITLILFIVNTIVILYENKVIPKFYQYILDNKREVLMYFICLIPLLTYVGFLYPGGASTFDTVYEFIQASGLEPLTNWHPVLIIWMMRVSLALHLPALTVLYVISICSIIYASIAISKTTKNGILKYVWLVLTYSFIIMMQHFYLIPKDVTSTFFIMFVVSMLLYSIFNKIDHHFYLGIIFLIIVSLIRHNQITQTLVIMIPFTILYQHNKKISILSTFKILLVFLIIVFGSQKLILNNRHIIQQTYPISWVQSSDITYIMLDQRKSCQEYQSFRPTMSCSEYHKLLTQFKKIQSTFVLKKAVSPMGFFIFTHMVASYHTKTWLKYLFNYPGSWLTFRYTTTLHNFLRNQSYDKLINYKSNAINTSFKLQVSRSKTQYNYSLGYVKFKRGGRTDRLISKLTTPVQFKYKLYCMILVLLITFMFNKFKVLPIVMENDLKYTCISYYLSLSCITLFIPLVLLVPTGMEARYLAEVDFPLMVSIVMLLIFLYKKYKYINTHIGEKNNT